MDFVFGLAPAAVIALGLALLFYTFHKIKKQILENLAAFFVAPGPDTPSQFAALIEVIADRLATKIITHAKGTFMGIQSGDTKTEKAMQGELATGLAAAQSPIMAAILASFPALSKRLVRNPALVPIAMSFLSKLRPGGNSGTPGSSLEAELKKYGGV